MLEEKDSVDSAEPEPEPEPAKPRKRLKLLDFDSKKSENNTAPRERHSSKAQCSPYDFKCSMFGFQKCQCDVRLRQDFEAATSGSCTCAKEITSDAIVIQKEETTRRDTETPEQDHNAREVDLFDEAVSRSICDSDSDASCERIAEGPSPDAEDNQSVMNLYEDLDEMGGTSSTKTDAGCQKIHKHHAGCGVKRRRCLEGVAIISTATETLASELVYILPAWTKLSKLALIHTCAESFEPTLTNIPSGKK